MNKLHRQIDKTKLEQSKQRSMAYVMDTIQQQKRFSWLRHLSRPFLVPALVFIIALVLILQPSNGPVDEPFTVSAQESQTLAEISYISSSLIAANITVFDDTFQFLSTSESTAFEQNNDEINMYFDMLKVFLEDDVFSDSVTITLLEDSPFTQLMEFTSNGITYQFYLAVNDEIISGELIVNTRVFTVSGTLEEEDDEYSIELEATRDNDYVRISYQTENNSEQETEYDVESLINGVTSTRQIRVSIEADEAKVEVEEGENSYQLKREIEDGQVQYKLEYSINDQEGEATIIETVDGTGQVTYSYQVKEGDVEKEIERGRPDYDYDEEEDEDDEDEEEGNGENNKQDDDLPGNSDDQPGNGPNEDEEDEDEDDPEDQSSDSTTTFVKKTL